MIKFSIRVTTSSDYDSLKESIDTNGLLDSIYVYERNDGKFVVIEGNTRRLIFEELHEKKPDDPRFNKIRAKILPKNTPKDKIAFIRLEYHLGGKTPWNPYERASYLYDLSEHQGYSHERLAKEARTSATEIKKDLKAFKVMTENFLSQYRDVTENPTSKYSYFVELIGKRKVNSLIIKNDFTLDEYCQWVAEGRIPRAIDVRDLPDIFSDQDVAEVFRESGYDAAMDVLSRIKPEVASTLFRDIEKVTKQLKELTLAEISQIRSDKTAKSKRDALKELIKQSTTVLEGK